MKQDLLSRTDVSTLINDFYQHVRIDPVIGYIFENESHINWEQHLPIMIDFWESILFDTRSYQRNPIEKHITLHQKTPLEKPHFDRWVELFHQAVDRLFFGPKANLAKERAISISTVIQTKIYWANNQL